MNKQLIRHYLQAQTVMDQATEQLIDECIHEVLTMSQFKAVYQIYNLSHHPLMLKEVNVPLVSDDLKLYFKNCHQCLIIACTLSTMIDRQLKYYEHIDMHKAVVFDAVSNAYLEECCDCFEKTLNFKERTFRLAPGYGDIPIQLNKTFATLLQIDKTLGVSMNSSGLLIPMKSMIGLVGIGKNMPKTCLSCIRKGNCELRKGGQRCYVKD